VASEVVEVPHLRPSLFEVDLDAIAHNIREIQRVVGAGVKLFAVLKCNAYGFGLKEVGQVVERSSAFGIAVGNLLEAVYLRRHGATKPILVYANNLAAVAGVVVQHDLMPTVQDVESAEAYARAASATGRTARVFVKVDVGLNRNGVLPCDAAAFCGIVGGLPACRIEGIYSHFDVPVPEHESREFVEWQFARFRRVLEELEEAGIRVPIRMVAHSSIVPHFPHMDLDAVDPGKLVYGLYDAEGALRPLVLKQAFRALRTRLVAAKRVSWDGRFNDQARGTGRPGQAIGVVPLGWGDGFPRSGGGKAEVLLHGKRVPVVGELTVEHARISLDDVPDARVGDQVVIIGNQGNEAISVAEVAQRSGMGLSEVSRSVREGVARLFHWNSRPHKVSTILGETLIGENDSPECTRDRAGGAAGAEM
jgi:alanine racemase